MSKSIEDTRALLGERIAILAAEAAGTSIRQTNLMRQDVRDAADAYALSVLLDMPAHFFNFEDEHICPDDIGDWVDDQHDCIVRLRDDN